MADATLTRETVFPEGTSVGAFPASNWPAPGEPTGAPIGSATAEATVEEGSATFTELEPETAYWAVAEIGGTHRYVSIYTGQGKEVTGARDEPEGALKSLLTVLASEGIITDSTTES